MPIKCLKMYKIRDGSFSAVQEKKSEWKSFDNYRSSYVNEQRMNGVRCSIT